MFEISEIIDLAIQIEKNGEGAYRKAQKETSDSALAAFLRWLADEEVQHAQWFTELNERVSQTVESPELAHMGNKILKSILGEQTFSLKEADFSKMEHIKALFEVSIEFEKDTALFYEMLRVFMEDEETLKHLDAIIEEENRHVQVLQDYLTEGKVPGLSQLS